MTPHEKIIETTAKETALFLGRRIRKLRTEISGVLNINPFLMRARETSIRSRTKRHSPSSC